ncbi:MAG: hypothetical protein AAGC43_04565 [Bacteroidota bacterium]
MHYKKIIESIVKSFPVKHREDLTQECHLLLIENSANIYKSNNQSGYVYTMLTNHCVRWIEDNVNKQVISLDNFTKDEEGEKTRFSDLVESRTNESNRFDAKHSLEVLEQNMPYPDYKVLELYHSGYSPEDIIENFPELGIESTRTIYRILRDR